MEWRLICQSSPASREIVDLRILTFDSFDWPLRPESEGQKEFSCQVSRSDYAFAIESAAKELLERHGHAGYLELWGDLHRFPSRALAALSAALAPLGNETSAHQPFH